MKEFELFVFQATLKFFHLCGKELDRKGKRKEEKIKESEEPLGRRGRR